MLAAALLFGAAHATAPSSCPKCAALNATQAPFRVYGNTYYVGVRGLSSILITSDRGHVLIDGDLVESAPKIAASIRALGFRVEDVKLILNTHIHYDHAGGIAALQQMSHAQVAASASSAAVLTQGHSGRDDPQYGLALPIPAVAHVRIVKDGETLRVGPLALTAHLTPGHTPGGTSWSWQSCEGARCLNIVYADSLTPISADGFKFTASRDYPQAPADFERSFATLSALACDILVTPHPEVSDLWGRLKSREQGNDDALIDADACRRYAERSRKAFEQRVARERAS
jgi:metallo-beta-lactamase class B